MQEKASWSARTKPQRWSPVRQPSRAPGTARLSKEKEGENAKLRNQLSQLRMAAAAAADSSTAPMETDGVAPVGTGAPDITAANHRIKKAEKALKAVQGVEQVVWEQVQVGARSTKLASLEAELAAAHAAKRALRSPQQQKKAEGDHIKKLHAQLEEVGTRKEELVAQRSELDRKIAEVKSSVAELVQCIAKSKAKVIELGDILQQKLRGSSEPAPQESLAAGHLELSSEATAAVVKGYLNGLPQEVTSDPQGKQTIEQVLGPLGKLDHASNVVASSAALAAAGEAFPTPPVQELDDEQVPSLADLFTDAVDNEGAESRAARVAATKVKLGTRSRCSALSRSAFSRSNWHLAPWWWPAFVLGLLVGLLGVRVGEAKSPGPNCHLDAPRVRLTSGTSTRSNLWVR